MTSQRYTRNSKKAWPKNLPRLRATPEKEALALTFLPATAAARAQTTTGGKSPNNDQLSSQLAKVLVRVDFSVHDFPQTRPNNHGASYFRLPVRPPSNPHADTYTPPPAQQPAYSPSACSVHKPHNSHAAVAAAVAVAVATAVTEKTAQQSRRRWHKTKSASLPYPGEGLLLHARSTSDPQRAGPVTGLLHGCLQARRESFKRGPGGRVRHPDGGVLNVKAVGICFPWNGCLLRPVLLVPWNAAARRQRTAGSASNWTGALLAPVAPLSVPCRRYRTGRDGMMKSDREETTMKVGRPGVTQRAARECQNHKKCKARGGGAGAP